jgi:hypothetical protein
MIANPAQRSNAIVLWSFATASTAIVILRLLLAREIRRATIAERVILFIPAVGLQLLGEQKTNNNFYFKFAKQVYCFQIKKNFSKIPVVCFNMNKNVPFYSHFLLKGY